MPLDAFCLAAIRAELAKTADGARIEKVQQPERDVLIFTLRGALLSGAPRLLISAGHGDARVHLTDYQFENPASPPMFCMLLRKHLTGARITSITQPPAERVLEFTVQAPDAIGVYSEKRLVIELMGRSSNIILQDTDGIIIDCLRRIGGDFSESEKRAVLPGLLYRPPPPQEGKRNPLTFCADEWPGLFCSRSTGSADKWLVENFSGLSPLICRELAWRAYGEADIRLERVSDGGERLLRELTVLTDRIKTGSFEPHILMDNGTPRDFSYIQIGQYEGTLTDTCRDSFSAMLDDFFTRKSQLERVRQRASAMTKTVKNARDRFARKLEAQRAELEKTKDRERLRECGDLITANIHALKKGQTAASVQDFYSDSGGEREIVLDPLKTPQQNAARYYKEYTKAKNAEKFITEQLEAGMREHEYLESVLEEIELAEGERDLEEIRRELSQTGYMRSSPQEKGARGNKKRPAAEKSAPLRFGSSAGFEILAGRSNTQNDMLTLKAASKSDIWLHVKNIHGSHVIIVTNGAAPEENTILEAAAIAAWYSRARNGGKVMVDYCLVKHVKKPPGGRPGAVIYTDYRTVTITPDEELVKRLRR